MIFLVASMPSITDHFNDQFFGDENFIGLRATLWL